MALSDIPGRVLVRLAERLDAPSPTECWPYTFKLNVEGYGRIGWGDAGTYHSVSNHRAAYEMWVGDIPGDLTVDHVCRNKACCNPTHLRLLTGGENTAARWEALGPRTHCKWGHELAQENVRFDGKRRWCRTCNLNRSRAFNDRKRKTANG